MADRSEDADSPANRRSFLRGSAAAALAVGLTASLPWDLFAGQGSQNAPAGEQKREEKKPNTRDQDAKDPEDTKDTDAQDATDNDPKDDETKTDPTLVTKHDANGQEYRICPQCGFNMYRQNQTWTCENCGYSYVE